MNVVRSVFATVKEQLKIANSEPRFLAFVNPKNHPNGQIHCDEPAPIF